MMVIWLVFQEHAYTRPIPILEVWYQGNPTIKEMSWDYQRVINSKGTSSDE